jgi:L-gulono-1,4-lactone dehydrogenase
MKIKKTPSWENTIKRYISHPIRYFIVHSLADIQQVIREAEEKKVKVRAVGSGHSFSDVAITNDYFIDISKLDEVKMADKSRMRPSYHDKIYVEAQGGIVLRKLNRKLDKLDVAMINMGGIDHQTLAGVISTATHGTGCDLPSIPGFVQSLTIVAAGGNVYRIEPSNGITDPATFNEPGIKLVQDDNIFHSVLVSFGCSGVIYSCIIEVYKQYLLRETKINTTWEAVKLKILDGSIFSEGDDESEGKAPRCCSLLINPYEIRGDKHYCIVMRHYYYTGKTGKLRLIEATRNIISQVLGNIPYFFFYTYWLFRVFPHRSPFLIRGSLKGMRDKKFVHRAHKVMYQGFAFIKERAYDAEFAFDLSNKENIVKTIDDLIQRSKEIKDNHKVYQSSPIGMRFVQRSKAYLAPEYGKEVAYIDVPLLLGINGNERLKLTNS